MIFPFWFGCRIIRGNHPLSPAGPAALSHGGGPGPPAGVPAGGRCCRVEALTAPVRVTVELEISITGHGIAGVT